jgi:hypothetical protein
VLGQRNQTGAQRGPEHKQWQQHKSEHDQHGYQHKFDNDRLGLKRNKAAGSRRIAGL